MAFFSALAALALEHFRPLRPNLPHYVAYARYLGFIEARFNAGGVGPGVAGWVLAVLPVVLVSGLVFAVLDGFSPLLGWVWNVAVLYATLGFRYFAQTAEAIAGQLRSGDSAGAAHALAQWRNSPDTDPHAESQLAALTLEQLFSASQRQLFGPLFWFLALALLGLGPVGAVLYRAASILARRWAHAAGLFGVFAQRAFLAINRVPAMLTAVLFAVAGNFEDALYSWRTQAAQWPEPDEAEVIAAGAGALGVQLGGAVTVAGEPVERPVLGLGAVADAEHIDSGIALVWRSLGLCGVVCLFFVLGGWMT